MIELFEQNERKADRQSSKGNQLKWENEGIWYKADCTGYEGLAEYMVSHLLEKSSLGKNEFVQYDYEQIKYKNVFYITVLYLCSRFHIPDVLQNHIPAAYSFLICGKTPVCFFQKYTVPLRPI